MQEILAIIIIFVGLAFDFGGTLGILRMPDVYTRLHMAGKLDTMGSLCLLLGIALATADPWGKDELFLAGKILLILVMVFIANPTATHAIADAFIRSGLTAWEKGDIRR